MKFQFIKQLAINVGAPHSLSCDYVFILIMEEILMIVCVLVYFPAHHIHPLLWLIKVAFFCNVTNGVNYIYRAYA